MKTWCTCSAPLQGYIKRSVLIWSKQCLNILLIHRRLRVFIVRVFKAQAIPVIKGALRISMNECLLHFLVIQIWLNRLSWHVSNLHLPLALACGYTWSAMKFKISIQMQSRSWKKSPTRVWETLMSTDFQKIYLLKDYKQLKKNPWKSIRKIEQYIKNS